MPKPEQMLKLLNSLKTNMKNTKQMIQQNLETTSKIERKLDSSVGYEPVTSFELTTTTPTEGWYVALTQPDPGYIHLEIGAPIVDGLEHCTTVPFMLSLGIKKYNVSTVVLNRTMINWATESKDGANLYIVKYNIDVTELDRDIPYWMRIEIAYSRINSYGLCGQYNNVINTNAYGAGYFTLV